MDDSCCLCSVVYYGKGSKTLFLYRYGKNDITVYLKEDWCDRCEG